jgi:Protein of unknown function (DUF3631)
MMTSPQEASRAQAAFPENPSDCNDPLIALELWAGKIAKDATGSDGLSTLTAACRDMAKRAPIGDAFRNTVIKQLLDGANRHLSDSCPPEAIEQVFFEAFPEQASADHAKENARLDVIAVVEDRQVDTEAELKRLASLPPIKYEQERETAATLLDVRVQVLDREVQKLRKKHQESAQGQPFEIPQPKPWPHSVDGAKLLTQLASEVTRYMVLPDHAPETVALWIVHTYCFDYFMHSPRLAIKSPEKRCGKTTLLDFLNSTVARPLSAANMTHATVFRIIAKAQPTLLIDEADTFLTGNDDLRGVLNAGHRKNGAVLRTVGDGYEPRRFSCWAPIAIALIGKLPGTLEDRSVSVTLRRKRPRERVEAFRSDRVDHLTALASKALRWSLDHEEALRAADPDLGELHNRVADNWRPLIAIADEAGGPWPEQGRKIANAAAAGGVEHEVSTQLLADIKALFDDHRSKSFDHDVAALRSREIIAHLVGIEGRQWAEWGRQAKPITENALARLLHPYGIAPTTLNLGGTERPRGYSWVQFRDAFETYLDEASNPEIQTATPLQIPPNAEKLRLDNCSGGEPIGNSPTAPNAGGNELSSTVAVDRNEAGRGERVIEL